MAYDHVLVQHEFTRKCLRLFTENISSYEYATLEEDLDATAETIMESGQGYDLDKRLAELEAENKRLREAHQELFRLARDVADHVRDTSWNMGAIRRLTRYVDSQP